MLALSDMSTDARAVREAQALGEAGHEVAVFALRAQGLPNEERRDAYDIIRVADFTSASWRRPLAKIGQSRTRRRSFIESAVRWSPDVVHAHGLDTLPLAFRISTRLGSRVVFDAHELHDEMLKSNRASVPEPLLRYWRHVEKKLLPKADAVITVGDEVADEILRRTGIRPSVVLNVPPLETQVTTERLAVSLGLGDQVVVLYQGLVNHGRGLAQMIRALEYAPGVALAIQGPSVGDFLDSLLNLAAEIGVSDRVRYLGVAPMSELHRYCSAADIGLLAFDATSLNNTLAMPNKLFQYMMAGLPMLGSVRLPAIRKILENEQIGLVCDPEDPGDMARRLLEMARDLAMRKRMGARARELSEERYNWDIEKGKLVALYVELGQR